MSLPEYWRCTRVSHPGTIPRKRNCIGGQTYPVDKLGPDLGMPPLVPSTHHIIAARLEPNAQVPITATVPGTDAQCPAHSMGIRNEDLVWAYARDGSVPDARLVEGEVRAP